MQDYARKRTAKLLSKLGVVLKAAEQKADPDAIHDLRVAIRRLKRCLKVFAPFYPDRFWKKIDDELSNLMSAAGAVRDCDIAIELLKEAGVSPRSLVTRRVVARRGKAGYDLVVEIRRWDDQHFLEKWKSRLEVEA